MADTERQHADLEREAQEIIEWDERENGPMPEGTRPAELVRVRGQIQAEYEKPWTKNSRPLPKGYCEGYDAALSLVLDIIDAALTDGEADGR